MTSFETLSVPADIALLSSWWAGADLGLVALAFILPFVVWLLRKWLALGFILPVLWIANTFKVDIAENEKQRVLDAIGAVCLAASLCISYYLLNFPGTADQILFQVVRVVLIVTVFRFLNELAQGAIAQTTRKSKTNSNVVSGNWLPQFTTLLLLVLMIVVILKGWGIDLGPALTGLGIAGAAVALAAQDLIRNLIAGVSIAAERRFKVGDWILLSNGEQGIVQKMELRSTVIKKFDQSTFFVPNAELANASLTNFSERSCRRLRWQISTTYPTDTDVLEDLCTRVFNFIDTNEHFVRNEEFDCFVQMFEFKASSVDMLVDCYVASNNWKDELRARHALVLGIKRIFADANVHFAFPTINLVGAENDTKGPMIRKDG